MLQTLIKWYKERFSSAYREDLESKERNRLERIKNGYIVDESGVIEAIAEKGFLKAKILFKWRKVAPKKVVWSFFTEDKEFQLIDLKPVDAIKKSPYQLEYYKFEFESDEQLVLEYRDSPPELSSIVFSEYIYRLIFDLKNLTVKAEPVTIHSDGVPHWE
ncbi:MAG: hypothetical protein KKB51_02100 [Candidatus Riflebacteria bacterium]|nr:hypothetical protein [Candidatus Riflebacteria bacterium]